MARKRDQNMKREPRITLPIKKPAKVDKLEPQWRLWIWYFLLTLLVLWGWQELANQVQFRTIPYSQFKTYLAQHEITEAVVKQDEIDGRIVPRAEHETKNTPAEHGSPTASPEATQQPPADANPFFFRPPGVHSRAPGSFRSSCCLGSCRSPLWSSFGTCSPAGSAARANRFSPSGKAEPASWRIATRA